MLSWTRQFNIFCFLDNCNYGFFPREYECLLGAGSTRSITTNKLTELDQFLRPGQWSFGHLSYELKNTIHNFPFAKEDRIGFPTCFFFEPQFLLLLKLNELVIHTTDPDAVFEELMTTVEFQSSASSVSVTPRLSKEAYLARVEEIQKHILLGDCYEVNFCTEFFSEQAVIDPFLLYRELIAASPNPYAAFYRVNDQFLLCASPERFLQKTGENIISQPMKGTIRREPGDTAKDELLKEELRHSAKDQAENVMVVDLVRNDLTKICRNPTVKVDELFGVYSYPRVHQMISTISGQLREDTSFGNIIEATFPMGSMTGAPKRRVMELIDEYEPVARGIFSGTVGYIDPAGDFDLNVVIRSLMYNASSKYLSYQVGSGITFYSNPHCEWEECLLKAEAIKKVLTAGPAPIE